jgi:hypothetical protein
MPAHTEFDDLPRAETSSAQGAGHPRARQLQPLVRHLGETVEPRGVFVEMPDTFPDRRARRSRNDPRRAQNGSPRLPDRRSL